MFSNRRRIWLLGDIVFRCLRYSRALVFRLWCRLVWKLRSRVRVDLESYTGVASRGLEVLKYKSSELEASCIYCMLASKECTLVEISELLLRTKVGDQLKPRLAINTSTGGCIRMIG